MNAHLRLSAEDAWSPIELDHLTLAGAAHLFRRAGFGANLSELTAATKLPLTEVVEGLLTTTTGAEFEQQSQIMKTVIQAGNLPVHLPAWWLYRFIQSPCQAWEKLVLFWHGHFATSAAKVNSALMMLTQNETIRRAAYGPFESLVLEISRDPAMLIYLDSATNRRNNPNENYARELLELFCLGLGNYSEIDIRELARAFTGWEIQSGRFAFNQFQHDPTLKRLLGNANIESGEQAVAWIVQQPAAAKFIAQKLYRFYVSDLTPDPEVLQSLAAILRENKFEIRPVLKMMFTSRIFYSNTAYGQKIRSPVELAIGLLHCLNATASPVQLASNLSGLGQSVFYPPSVKGWDGGKRWINSATMIGRINLIAEILNHKETRFVGDKNRLDKRFDVDDAESAVRHVEAVWLSQPLNDEHRSKLSAIVEKSTPRRESRLLWAFKSAATLAESQLG